MIRKGMVLAGGAWSRLYPITRSVAKPLLAVYDKPPWCIILYQLLIDGIKGNQFDSVNQILDEYAYLIEGNQLPFQKKINNRRDFKSLRLF